MTANRDFLDEIVDERSAVTSTFAGMVEAAFERRLALRARTDEPDGGRERRDSGRRGPGETDGRRGA